MSKIHVAVLRGGPSNQYDLSLKTGGTVLQTLSQGLSGEKAERYRPIDIFISKDGVWHRDGAERSPERALIGADVAFNALHGQFGEDGTVQKILDAFGVPYTGSNAMASALGMNKVLAKDLFTWAGIKTPYYYVVRSTDDLRAQYQHVFHHFLLPFVVKPASGGSSAGISIVKKYVDFYSALEAAFAHSDAALIEEYIRGREASAGIVDHFRSNRSYPLPPIERIILPGQEMHDICPTTFSDAEKRELERVAALAHRLMNARHYSQTDFIVSPRRGIFALEINTLPELSPASLLPKSLDAIGCTFGDFLDHVIGLALNQK